MLRLPLGFGLRGFARLLAYDEVGRRLHHLYAPQPHWYLAAIGVDVGHQGRGIGSALMRPMLARADAEGVACWLDTHQEQNMRCYGATVLKSPSAPGEGAPDSRLRHAAPAAITPMPGWIAHLGQYFTIGVIVYGTDIR